jgi:pSer/pThr/pTyr-binding forkhead associated (FHA) protein
LFLDDEFVTRKHPHARLTRQPDGSWLLIDLGSTNGTYINGHRLTAPTVVTPADTIQIGRTQLRLEP